MHSAISNAKKCGVSTVKYCVDLFNIQSVHVYVKHTSKFTRHSKIEKFVPMRRSAKDKQQLI